MNPESDPMVNASPGKMIRVGAAKGDLAAEAEASSFLRETDTMEQYTLCSLHLPIYQLLAILAPLLRET